MNLRHELFGLTPLNPAEGFKQTAFVFGDAQFMCRRLGWRVQLFVHCLGRDTKNASQRNSKASFVLSQCFIGQDRYFSTAILCVYFGDLPIPKFGYIRSAVIENDNQAIPQSPALQPGFDVANETDNGS